MKSLSQGILSVVRRPLHDYLNALGPSLGSSPALGILVMAVCFALSWWIYVPVHELLHVAGCLLGGGEVTRLEMDPLYGAALLQRVFPFITVGSDYAGQLTGFDTHGSDVTYLLTDFLPFVLTIVLGVPLLCSAARGRPGIAAAAKTGAALPIALAPFISIPGDYYEMGSILVSRFARDAGWVPHAEQWRGDDVMKKIEDLFLSSQPAQTADVAGVAVSLCLGIALAFATYALGRAWTQVWQGRG